MDDETTITELAKEFAVTTRTIRFYEDEGLISPERRGTQRIYHPRDRVRLKLILRGKRLGFSLRDIREIIDLYDTEIGEVGQLDYFLKKISERRDELLQKQRDIELTLRELVEVEDSVLSRRREIEKRGNHDGEADASGGNGAGMSERKSGADVG